MRKMLFLAALLAAAPASANQAIYGSALACQRYMAGGVVALNTDGPANGLSTENYLLITPRNVLGLEWGCDLPGGFPARLTKLNCSGQGDVWTVTAKITSQQNAVAYKDEDGEVVLSRCK